MSDAQNRIQATVEAAQAGATDPEIGPRLLLLAEKFRAEASDTLIETCELLGIEPDDEAASVIAGLLVGFGSEPEGDGEGGDP